jgi:DNA-binding protein HU-beta
MNRADLIGYVAKDCKVSKEHAALAVESVLNNIKHAVTERNEKVALKGFGTFSVGKRAQKKSINPQNPQGDRLTVAAYDSFDFDPAGELKKFKVYPLVEQ